MTAVLQQWGHRVTAIEVDPEAAAHGAPYAEEMIVADLDDEHVLDRFVGADFDVILAADVLEHLRSPTDVLRRAVQCLRRDGSVHLSIPNVAHADVRLALLGGDFRYAESGLLDRTHIQMFTVATLMDMIRDAGLAPETLQRLQFPIGGTEVPVDENLVEFGRRVLAGDPDAETYQWLVTCRRAEVLGDCAARPALPGPGGVVSGVLSALHQPVPHPDPLPVHVGDPNLVGGRDLAVALGRRVVSRGRRSVGSLIRR